MKTQQAINLAGSASALAKLLGITDSAISQWGEAIPTARVWQLRVLCPTWFEPPVQSDLPFVAAADGQRAIAEGG
jgi:hypothetical protein